MEIQHLTPELIESILKNIRKHGPHPDEIHDLAVLRGIQSPKERIFRLQDWLYSVVQTELTERRRQYRVPEPGAFEATREAVERALHFDFAQGDAHLEAWSALYYRYLTPSAVSAQDAADFAHVVPRQFRRRVSLGVDLLTKALQRIELEARWQDRHANLKRYLPLPEYQVLFGVEEQIDRIASLLESKQGQNLVSVEGIGGIGKTAVTRAVANRLAEDSHLDFIAWISARQQRLSPTGALVTESDPVRSLDDIVMRLSQQLGQEQLAGLDVSEKLVRLQKTLQEVAGLVVIDNLETLSELTTILPALAPLAGENTRFLLTSRHTVRQFPYVQTYVLPELTPGASKSLVLSELKRLGSNLNISDDHIQRIYVKTGGLPLALKLVAAQMALLPLERILQDLDDARFASTEEMYAFIYYRTWQKLDDHARSLLLSMLLISPEGEDLEWLRMSSDLDDRQFHRALGDLIAYSLLETTGTTENLIYSLHRMTITFLQTKVLLDWGS